MFKKVIILSLYFFGRDSLSSLGQTYQACTLMEPCHYNRLVTAIQQELPPRRDNTEGCSKYLDSLCFRLLVQDLADARQPIRQKRNLLMRMHVRYPQAEETLPDTLVIPIMLSELRYDTGVAGLGSIEKTRNVYFEAGNIGRFIIRKGKASIPFLRDLLTDFTELYEVSFSTERNWGYSYHDYKLRRRDFAYFYLSLILGEKPEVCKTQTERDFIIDQFILKKRKQLFYD